MQHFLSLNDLSSGQLKSLIGRAGFLKKQLHTEGKNEPSLANKVLVMIFEKPSTRTRLSFEIGMQQLGGWVVFLAAKDSQLGRGEPVCDTARVIASMADLVMIRSYSHQRLEAFRNYSKIPVINALSDRYHPCQVLADMLTIEENLGKIEGTKVAWVGDGNNVCNSYINAAKKFQFELSIYTPQGYEPDQQTLQQATGYVHCHDSPHQALAQADVVTTDVWSSMGQEQETERRLAFEGCQVNQALLKQAKKEAIFLHCLPAYRGQEVSAEVLEGSQSRVWQQAENRLHVQKALLELLLLGSISHSFRRCAEFS